jgi:hypothetical protein
VDDCVLYGSKGEELAKVTPEGSVPVLSADENQVKFSCDASDGPIPRLKLTVISHGEPL